MGHIPVAKPSPIPRTLRFPHRVLAIALILAGFVVLAAVIVTEATPSADSPIYGPHWVTVMPANQLFINDPHFDLQDRGWLIKQPSGEIVALYAVSTGVERCRIAWRPDFLFRNHRGWFRSPCHGDTYDLTGTCVDACPRDMDRYEARTSEGKVQIRLGARTLIEGTVRNSSMIATHATNAELTR